MVLLCYPATIAVLFEETGRVYIVGKYRGTGVYVFTVTCGKLCLSLPSLPLVLLLAHPSLFQMSSLKPFAFLDLHLHESLFSSAF